MLQWVHKLVSFWGFVPSECWTNFIAIILDPNWVQDWGGRDANGSRGGRGCYEPPVLHRPDVHVRDVASLQLRRSHRQEGASLHTALRSGVLDVCHWVFKQVVFSKKFRIIFYWWGDHFRRSKTSHQDINQMGARAKETGKKLFIYPEGTRNSAKGLTMLPFKKGAFHIAVDCKLPIQPIVLSEYDFLDVKKWIFNPGKVTIKVLPRIDTSGYTKDNLDDLVSHTRNLMIEELKNLAKPNKTDWIILRITFYFTLFQCTSWIYSIDAFYTQS